MGDMHKHYRYNKSLFYINKDGLVIQKTVHLVPFLSKGPNTVVDITLEEFMKLKPEKVNARKFNEEVNQYWSQDSTEWTYGGEWFKAIPYNPKQEVPREIEIRFGFKKRKGETITVQHQGKVFNAVYYFDRDDGNWMLFDMNGKFVKWTNTKHLKLVYNIMKRCIV